MDLGRIVLRFLDYTKLDINTHKHTHLVGLLCTSDQLVAVAATCTTYNKHKETKIHVLSAIRNRVPSNHAAADLRPCAVRPPGSANVYKYRAK